MSLMLMDRKPLWVPTGDLGAQVSTSDYLLNTANTLTQDDDSIPTASIHSLDVNGADAIHLVCGTKVATLTGNRTCTAMDVRIAAWGIPEGVGDLDPLSNVPALRADTALTSTQNRAYALSVFPTDPTMMLPVGLVDMSINVATNIIWIADSTNVAANDYVLSSWWLGRRTDNYTTSAALTVSIASQFPRISGVKTIKLAIKYSPTLGAGGGTDITAFTLSGGLYALLYKEVTMTRRVAKSARVPGYLQANISAGS